MTDTTSQESGDWHVAGPGPATTGQSQAPQEAPATLAGRIRRSFLASVGSIVFGMEDGTVSIFGLVFGVAASAPDSRAVLLAGGTGAVAAALRRNFGFACADLLWARPCSALDNQKLLAIRPFPAGISQGRSSAVHWY